MDPGVGAAAATQPTSPVTLDAASLERLASLLSARRPPPRPALMALTLVFLIAVNAFLDSVGA